MSWFVFLNPIWTHTGEYVRNTLKVELLSWFMVWLFVTGFLEYVDLKRGSLTFKVIRWSWVVGSGVCWVYVVLSIAQRWVGV